LAFLLFYLANILLLSPNAPFIPITQKILPRICELLELKSGNTVYDLGCGDGRFLIFAAQKYPETGFVGIESNFIAFWLASFNSRNLTNVNFFKCDLSPADAIYAYLFPKVMNPLLDKLQKELRPGSKMVSCDFYFENKKPESILNLDTHKLYTYKF
jgi:tRNA G46 methylase TrmB